MTDEQFKALRAIQFAQLALLQSIDANLRQLALAKDPARAAAVNFSEARALIERVQAGPGRRR
jgi:hypothetical protein